MRSGKRLLALNLALLLVVVLLPLQAFAADITLDKTHTFTRSANNLVEDVGFTAPETGFYRISLTCPSHPDCPVTSYNKLGEGMHVGARDDRNESVYSWFDAPIFILEAGTHYQFTFYAQVLQESVNNYYGDWTWAVSRLEPAAFDRSAPMKVESPLYCFTAQEDGAIQILRTDWTEGSKCRIFAGPDYTNLGLMNATGSDGYFNLAAKAGTTYYIVDEQPAGKVSLGAAQRSGVFGDDQKINWSVSDDGVLTISGTDGYTYTQTMPWSCFGDEITKLVIADDAYFSDLWYAGLPNLQDIQISERDTYYWKDGAYYNYYFNGAEQWVWLLWVRPDVKTLDLAENVEYINYHAFQNARGLETLIVRNGDIAEGYEPSLLYGATALKDIYYYPENLTYTPFYGTETSWDLSYKSPAPVVHYMAADQELPKQRTQTYPATRVGMAEMLYDYMDLPDGTYSAEKADETFNDLAGLTQRQKEAVEMLVERGISKGSSESTFSPELTNNRAQAATYLWRALHDDYYPYSTDYELYDDVSRSDYYFESANWCDICPFVEFDGVTGRTFGPKVELKTLTITTPVITKDGVEYITGDKVITVSPEETAEPTTQPDDPTPAQPTTKPDDPKPTTKPDDPKPTTKPDDTKPEPKPIKNPFVDVASGDYFYDPVLWALTHEPQITDGMTETTFAPADTCTRGQVVTFLWRAMGCAEPKSANNPFSDVAAGEYFTDAVLWAVSKQITDGTSDTTFSPADPCTRGQIVTFLYRDMK